MSKPDIFNDCEFYDNVLNALPIEQYVAILADSKNCFQFKHTHLYHEWHEGRLPNGMPWKVRKPCMHVVTRMAQIDAIRKFMAIPSPAAISPIQATESDAARKDK